MQNKLKLLTVAVLALQAGLAQNAGTIRGSVTDPSAAVIQGVTVEFTGNGSTKSAKTDAQGKFTITLPPGSYGVRADAKGFVTFLQQGVAVSAGQVSPLDIALQIAAQAQEVQVSDQAAGQGSVDPSSNVGALVLKNEDLDALPDDPDDLQADLEALAGPAAGSQRSAVFRRRVQRRAVAPEEFNSRNPHQFESFFGGIRPTRLRTHRNSHQARYGSRSTAVE